MDSGTRRALAILRRMRRVRIPSGPVTLSAEYVRAVRILERLPENRDGADKTWVYQAQREFRDYYAKVRRRG